MKSIFYFLILFSSLSALGQRQITISGQVLSEENIPVPFASVALVGMNRGVITDIDGRFDLVISDDYTGEIVIRHVSYQTRVFGLNELLISSIVTISKKTTQLENLVFEAGENPANSIIRKVIRSRKTHNPSKRDSYKYTSYTKEVYRFDMNGSQGDSILALIKSRNPNTYTSYDSAFLKFEKNMNQNHLIVSEVVADVKYISPGVQNEVITAANISGFENNILAATGSGYQPFGFYESIIPLFDKEFVNPINPAGLQQYDFYIEDTTFFDRDEVFVISFEPKKNKKFESLHGFLYVHSQDYSLTNVIAESLDPLAKTAFKIQQVYDRIGGEWFPIQLNTDVTFQEYQFYGRPMKLENKRYLFDIDLSPQLTLSDFSDVLIDIQSGDQASQEELIDRRRIGELDSLEANTFVRLDTLAQSFKTIEKIFEIFATQRIEIGKLDLRVSDFVGFNRYEKFRLGMGMETNDKFSKKLKMGGYGAYGFGDGAWKYGGDIRWEFSKRTRTNILATYKDDIREIGGIRFFEQSVPKFADIIRVWQGNLFDRQKRYGVFFNSRLAPFFYAQVGWSASEESTTYDYTFDNGEVTGSNYQWNEVSISLRYGKDERYIDLNGRRSQLTSGNPSVQVKYSQGNSSWLAGDFDFRRVDLSMEYRKKYRLGISRITIIGGYIEGDVPYGRMITGWGNGPSYWSVPNYFQTMGLYEFASDQAVGLLFNHNFGNVLYASRISKPELLIYQNSAIGDLARPDQHDMVSFATLDQGYLESGVGLNNLGRFNYGNIMYWGLGVEVFYRYGAYAFDQTSDNFFYKFGMNFSF